MSIPEQMEAFAGDIENVVDRYRAEFNLPALSAVGVLELYLNFVRASFNAPAAIAACIRMSFVSSASPVRQISAHE